ncbi:MAG TPA: LuxR C-terminal-related transcriptional regulator [Albitalea sp.]|uniref:helix-turn-helix transcriptional regulator n=1 Tax=Piscinibacter sp. TaxID=1903157 RepID=UPI002ED3B196
MGNLMHDTATSATLLLALYRAARELPTQAFQDHALRLIKPLLRFDTAIWGVGTRDGKTIKARAAHLHEVDPVALTEWKAINGRDKVTQLGLGNVGRTVHAHIPTLYAESADAEYRAYAARWKRRDMLGTAMSESTPGDLQWVSLYRHDAGLYTDHERLVCESLMPHFAEALRINQTIEQSRDATVAQVVGERRCLALADADGRLRFAHDDFLLLLRLEWTEIDEPRLPEPLVAAIAEHRTATFVGNAIKVRIRYSADLYLLDAEQKTLIDSLPPRRARIAALFAEGLSHKEIARRLRIAPPTVRNQIAAAYRDLGISSRTQLASLKRAVQGNA